METRRQKTDARHALGQRGEDLAARFLASQGFAIVARNWRPSHSASSARAASTCSAPEAEIAPLLRLRGELDAVAWEGEPFAGGVLCFVEVKSRASSEWGTPGQAVGAAKQRQVVRLAQAYIALNATENPRLWDAPCRFDVVEVWLSAREEPRLALHRAAFDASST